jgi:fimbrial chaperone protein
MRFLTGFLAAALLVLLPMAAQAARMSPMVVTIEPQGRQSIARVELSNPGQGEFPVEARVFRGEVDELGNISLAPADEDFLIFPASALVAPRSQQVFRIQYVGDPELDESQVYYLGIRQIPVELPASGTKVQVVFNFNVLVNVVPDGAEALPVVESVKPAVRDYKEGLEVRLSNAGNKFFLAGSSTRWTVSGTDANGSEIRETFARGALASEIGVGLVGPNKSRLFFVPTKHSFSSASVELDVAD